MIAVLLETLQSSDLATALRLSIWVYPLLSALHIAAIASIFGAILPLDLRLSGLWRSIPVQHIAAVARPVAAVGIIVAVASGGLLFSVDAVAYAGKTVSLAKLLFISLAIANALTIGRRAIRADAGIASRRLASGLSISFWLTSILLGRMIAYS